MVARTNRIMIVLAALAVGAAFVLTVRTAGLHEIAQRGHCGAMVADCRSGDSNNDVAN